MCGMICSIFAFILTIYYSAIDNVTIVETNPIMNCFLSLNGFILVIVYASIWAVLWSLYAHFERNNLNYYADYLSFLCLFAGAFDLLHDLIIVFVGI